MEGVNLTITPDSFKYIARKAIEFKLGARGLRTILETILTDAMYEIPSQKDINELTVDVDYVKGKISNSKLVKFKAA
jgi:ATP-dependent Clp protease ATP-binding subunit ClpX